MMIMTVSLILKTWTMIMMEFLMLVSNQDKNDYNNNNNNNTDNNNTSNVNKSIKKI